MQRTEGVSVQMVGDPTRGRAAVHVLLEFSGTPRVLTRTHRLSAH